MAFAKTSAGTSRVISHLKLCGLSQSEANRTMSVIHRWIKSSGDEWTVSRLKSLKVWFVQNLANPGSKENIPVWFKHKGNTPKGPFGVIFKLGNNPKKVAKALSALMSYTGFKSDSLTVKQYTKASTAIETPLSDKASKFIDALIDCEHPLYEGNLNKVLNTCRRSLPSQISYSFAFAGLNSSKPDGMFGKSWEGSFMNSLSYRPVYSFLKKKFGFSGSVPLTLNWSEKNDSPGEISLIQERGYKARVVAKPSSGVQVCLQPLHRFLNSGLKALTEDCTHNQRSGAVAAQGWLQEGRTVFAVDLSSATDRFPRKLSLMILRWWDLHDEADFIDNISDHEWYLSKELADRHPRPYVKYGTGQPMGAYSSFPLFAISHNLVLRMLCLTHKIAKSDDGTYPYRVLGDDVVIGDDRLHDAYRIILQELDVPVSEDKCISSNLVTEFAGFVITSKSILQPAKVPSGNLDNGFLNYVRVLGLNGLSSLPSIQRKVASAIAQAPESMGGLGLNPYGLSMSSRSINFVKATKEIKIPESVNLSPSFLQMMATHEITRESVNWLSDQDNYIQEQILGSLPKHLRGLPTDVNMLLYQLVHSDVDVPGIVNGFSGMENRVGEDLAPRNRTVYQDLADRFVNFEL